MVTIKDIYPICTAPEGIPLVIVKVVTSEPGLYGIGCATYTQRWDDRCHAVTNYMKPLLVGKDVTRIEDIWQMSMVSAYWRNGPVLNNAISGVDEALWDIKGKMAGMARCTTCSAARSARRPVSTAMPTAAPWRRSATACRLSSRTACRSCASSTAATAETPTSRRWSPCAPRARARARTTIRWAISSR